MPEPIDKKETIAKVFALSGFFVDRSDYEFELISAVIHRCCEEIDKQPTIKAEPVRHGRWILERQPDGTPYCLHCSECDPDFDVLYNRVATNYCPDCGTKMETNMVYERNDYDGTN